MPASVSDGNWLQYTEWRGDTTCLRVAWEATGDDVAGNTDLAITVPELFRQAIISASGRARLLQAGVYRQTSSTGTELLPLLGIDPNANAAANRRSRIWLGDPEPDDVDVEWPAGRRFVFPGDYQLHFRAHATNADTVDYVAVLLLAIGWGTR
jgi:hypothetical protein